MRWFSNCCIVIRFLWLSHPGILPSHLVKCCYKICQKSSNCTEQSSQISSALSFPLCLWDAQKTILDSCGSATFKSSFKESPKHQPLWFCTACLFVVLVIAQTPGRALPTVEANGERLNNKALTKQKCSFKQMLMCWRPYCTYYTRALPF